MPALRVYRLGTLPYEAAYAWQLQTADEVRADTDDALALLRHPHTITLGRRAHPEHLLLPREALERRGATVIESDRGGDVTYHGPGQLVAYPILNLRRRNLGPVDYVHALEETMLDVLQRFGLQATRIPGRPGAWLNGAKIGAVGVRIRDGVSTHGLALNVDCDLSWFETIIPCGFEDTGVTSVRAAGCEATMRDVEDALVESFGAMGYSAVENAAALTT